MSMLAERKRKQKWCLNPRGNLWSEDQNKFGKRLMEKMGWKDGKGLGAKEDGAIEHVKVSYKNDSKGMGFKENGEQWTAHEDHFTQLLKSLSNSESAPETEKPILSGQSLEQKSKSAKSRVHYHKFTRGKDLSRYSEKDLANIFGKKTLKKTEPKLAEEKQTKGNEEGEGKECKKSKFGVETVERGSMVDYFRQKLPHFSAKGTYEIGANGVLQSLPKIRARSESESESEQRIGFGFGFSQKDEKVENPNSSKISTFVSYVKSTDCSEIKSAEGKEEDGFLAGQQETEEDDKKKGKKEKKKNKRKLQSDEDAEQADSKRTKLDADGSFVNPAFDPLSRSRIVGVKHSLTTIAEERIEEEEDATESNEELNRETTETETATVGEASEIKETPKQKKKERKQKLMRVSEAVEPEIGGSSCFTNNVTEEESFGEEIGDECTRNENIPPNPYEVKRKSDKKGKKRKLESISQEDLSKSNEETLENCSERAIDVADSVTVPYEVKRKIKKSKKKTKGIDEEELKKAAAMPEESIEEEKKSRNGNEAGLDNPSLNLTDNGPGIEAEGDVSKSKKLKKQKKSKSTESGLDNPALNLSVDDQEALPLETSKDSDKGEAKEENKAKTKSKKSKSNKSMEEGLDNPALNLSAGDEANASEERIGFDNPALDQCEISNDSSEHETTKSTKAKSKKSKTKSLEDGLDNPALNLSAEDANESLNLSESSEKISKKKSKSKSEGLDNPALSLNTSQEEDRSAEEVKKTDKKRKKNKSKAQDPVSVGLDNPALNLDSTVDESVAEENDAGVVVDSATPKNCRTLLKSSESSVKGKKSVRFSEVNEERIIPNVLNPENNAAFGLVNEAFDLVGNVFSEGVDNLNQALDEYQNELENDMNEKKLQELEKKQQQQRQENTKPVKKQLQ